MIPNDVVFDGKRHIGVETSVYVSHVVSHVVDMSLENEDIITEPHENADFLSQPHTSVVVGRNLCITKNKARVVATPTILDKRRHQF